MYLRLLNFKNMSAYQKKTKNIRFGFFFYWGGGGITLYKYTDAEVCSFLYTTQKLLSIVIGIVVTYQFL